jgi:hypothetical protein
MPSATQPLAPQKVAKPFALVSATPLMAMVARLIRRSLARPFILASQNVGDHVYQILPLKSDVRHRWMS